MDFDNKRINFGGISEDDTYAKFTFLVTIDTDIRFNFLKHEDALDFARNYIESQKIKYTSSDISLFVDDKLDSCGKIVLSKSYRNFIFSYESIICQINIEPISTINTSFYLQNLTTSKLEKVQ